MESRLLSTLAETGRTIFTLKEVTDVLGTSYSNAKVVANRLSRKKWIIRLARGKYLIVPLRAGVRGHYTEHEFVIASHIADPYYVAYWSALNHHALTEQVPSAVFVATTKRVGSRSILGVKYKVVSLIARKFFGFSRVAVADSQVNISDIEKALTDALDHPEYSGGMSQVARAVWEARERASFEKVVGYAERMGNSTILKRLGYLAEILELDLPDLLNAQIGPRLGKGYSVLDPLAEREGHYSSKWNLLLNVSEESLLEWRRGY